MAIHITIDDSLEKRIEILSGTQKKTKQSS